MIILPVTFEAHSQTNGIWQLESYSDVLNCKLFFYYLPYYRWLTHDYSRMQKPLLYKVRNMHSKSSEQDTKYLWITLYILLLKQNGFLGLFELLWIFVSSFSK